MEPLANARGSESASFAYGPTLNRDREAIPSQWPLFNWRDEGAAEIQ